MPLYDQYRAGIRALIAALGSDHPRLGDALVFQHRLLEVLEDIERHGKSSDAAAESLADHRAVQPPESGDDRADLLRALRSRRGN